MAESHRPGSEPSGGVPNHPDQRPGIDGTHESALVLTDSRDGRAGVAAAEASVFALLSFAVFWRALIIIGVWQGFALLAIGLSVAIVIHRIQSRPERMVITSRRVEFRSRVNRIKAAIERPEVLAVGWDDNDSRYRHLVFCGPDLERIAMVRTPADPEEVAAALRKFGWPYGLLRTPQW